MLKLILKFMIDKSNNLLSLDLFDKQYYYELKVFACKLCGGTFNTPLMDLCGHIFCKFCINYHCKINEFCPINKEIPIKNSLTDLPALNKIFEKLQIKCKFHDKGCLFKGSIKQYNKHIKFICTFSPILCPNQGCKYNNVTDLKSLDKQTIDKHIKKCKYKLVKCELCRNDYVQKFINEHNTDDCPELTIPCYNKCGIYILRKDLINHSSVCINEPLDCLYRQLNCTSRIKRKNMNNHLQNNLHNDLFIYEINKIKKVLKIYEELHLDGLTNRKNNNSIGQKDSYDLEQGNNFKIFLYKLI